MANEEAAAAKIIAACTYSGAGVAVVKMFSWAELADFLTVRGQGAIGPTQRNVFRRDLHANLRVVGTVFSFADDTTATLLLAFYKMDGTSLGSFSLATMKRGSRGFDMNDESPPGESSGDFAHMGSMATSPITLSSVATS